MPPLQEVMISRNNSSIDLNSIPKEPRQEQQHHFIKVALEDKLPSSYEDALAGSQGSLKPAEEDAFLLYSDDEVRMTKLLLKDSEEQGSSSKRRRRQAAQRKTRISYEVHYSLVMEDEMLAMFDEDEDQDSEYDFDAIEKLDEDKMGELSTKEIMDILLHI